MPPATASSTLTEQQRSAMRSMLIDLVADTMEMKPVDVLTFMIEWARRKPKQQGVSEEGEKAPATACSRCAQVAASKAAQEAKPVTTSSAVATPITAAVPVPRYVAEEEGEECVDVCSALTGSNRHSVVSAQDYSIQVIERGVPPQLEQEQHQQQEQEQEQQQQQEQEQEQQQQPEQEQEQQQQQEQEQEQQQQQEQEQEQDAKTQVNAQVEEEVEKTPEAFGDNAGDAFTADGAASAADDSDSPVDRKEVSGELAVLKNVARLRLRRYSAWQSGCKDKYMMTLEESECDLLYLRKLEQDMVDAKKRLCEVRSETDMIVSEAEANPERVKNLRAQYTPLWSAELGRQLFH